MISEGPEALKKYIASGAIEELHDVMPHDDDNDYLNDAYLDDDYNDTPAQSSNLDVALPTPLQTAKIAQSLNQAQQQQQQQPPPSESKEKTRKSRFSDINEVDTSMDMDMRVMHPAMSDDMYGNGRISDMKNNFRDVDYRSSRLSNIDNMSSLRMDYDSMKNIDDDMMYGKNSPYDNQRLSSMDIDFRSRYDNYGSGDSPKFSNSPYGDRDSPWNSNDGYSKQGNNNSPSGDGFGFSRNSNFSGNQNGSFGSNGPSGSGHPSSFNYRGAPSPQGMGPYGNNFRSEGGSQFRSEGNWNNMPQRQDNYRNRSNFNQRISMRGGPSRNQRGYPGPRGPGGMWLPPRGNGPPPRGRNVF